MNEANNLSDLQVAVMRTLWEAGEATVAEVHAGVAVSRPLAPTTIATILSRLERRGLVSHRNRGRQYIYRAVVSEADVRQSMVSSLTSRLFDGDAAALVSHLLTSREVEAGDLEKIRQLLDEADSKEVDDASA